MARQGPPSDEVLVARISEDVAQLYLETFGKMPLHTDTFVNGDVVTTLLRDVFTVAETSLAEAGRDDAVLTTRMHWQSATDSQFRAVVAEATGRRVVAAISGFDLVNDMASEVFLLEVEEGT